MRHITITIVSFLLTFFFVNFVVGVTFTLFFSENNFSGGFEIFLTYGLSMGLTTVLFAMFKETLHLQISNLRPRIDKLNLPLVLLGLILISVFNMALDTIAKLLPTSDLSTLFDMMHAGLWVIVTGVILAPLIEEFLFRGILQRSLVAQSTPIWGIVLSSVIFGAIHIIPQQVLGGMSAGLVLGSIFFLTGSLTTVVMIHMLNNGVAYLQFLYLGSDVDVSRLIFSSNTAYVVAVVVSWVVIVGFAALLVKIVKSQKLK